MKNFFFVKTQIIKNITNNKTFSYFSSIKALPFNISRNQAENIVTRNSNYFQMSDSGYPLRKLFLPFYSANVIGLWSKFDGRLGIDRK
jgi:hypothetical protein